MKELIKKLPLLGPLAVRIYRRMFRTGNHPARFRDSSSYWQERYSLGSDSGSGSYGELAEFKAEVLNEFVETHGVRSVIEFGCGDGNQVSLGRYPEYTGFDISKEAIARCKEAFGSDERKTFRHLSEYAGETADLTLSLDVIYHLVKDDVYQAHMERLFDASRRFVIIYSSNTENGMESFRPHVRHRKFSD